MKGAVRGRISILGCVYAALVLALLVYVIFFTDVPRMLRGYPGEHYIEFTEGWRDGTGARAELQHLSAGSGSGTLELYHHLPRGIRNGESLNLVSHNLFFRVYLGGECVYTYDPGENLTGRGTGDVYHSISLSPGDVGEEIRIEVDLQYLGESGGRFPSAVITDSRTFTYLLFRENGLAYLLSTLIIFFGLAIFIIYFGIYRENEFGYDLPALAMSVILIGGWTLIESNVPQILIGTTAALRVLDYTLLPLMVYPIVRFINSIAKKQNPLYPKIAFVTMAVTLSGTISLRLIFGIDMHDLMPAFLLSYVIAIVLVLLILWNNHRYCRREGVPEELGYFYFGAVFFLAGGFIDMARYLLLGKAKSNNGSFLRLGLTIFIIAMFVQIIRWLTRERQTNRRDSFINSLMQYAMSGDSAEETIRQMLEYMGRELQARIVYIYEAQEDGSYRNSYTWEREHGSLPRESLERIADRELVEGFYYRRFQESGNVIVASQEQYKEIEPRLYRLLCEREISRMVVAPIRIDGAYAGFFGVVDPSEKTVEEVSEILRILEYFLSETISRRDTEQKLIRYSYYDQLTGVKNRRALREFEQTQLDTAKPYGFIMCDINGLKRVNDNEGHEAGDRMIRDVAEALAEVYGQDSVYRMGGDEFAVYDLAADGASFAAAFGRLQTALRRRGRSASLGYVYRPEGDPDYETVKKSADTMMYEDKGRYYSGRRDRRQV